MANPWQKGPAVLCVKIAQTYNCCLILLSFLLTCFEPFSAKSIFLLIQSLNWVTVTFDSSNSSSKYSKDICLQAFSNK